MDALPPTAHSTARPICVLSTGRAGTSVLTRTMNLLGIDLGPEADLAGPHPVNERGFWEQLPIMRLNDDILAALGGGFFDPPAAPEGWHRTPAMAPFAARVEQLVEDTFGGEGRWGFKDPRTVLTLPLWADVVGPMDYIICVRRAEEVVESLRRTGAPDGRRVEWWMDLNALALERTIHQRRLIVFHEDWFTDHRQVVERLARFLHGDAEIAADTWAEIDAFFEPSLRRVEPRGDDVAETSEADAVHALLRLAERGGDDPGERARQVRVARTLAAAARARVDAAEELGRRDAQLGVARAELARITGSRGWRLTAPLRRVGR